MATVSSTVCDVNPDEPAVASVTLVVGANRYRLDAGATVMATLQPILAAAESRTVRARERSPVREWAAANAVECPTRGRIPQAVHDAYLAAQQ